MPFTHTEGIFKTKIYILKTIDQQNNTSFINHITVRSEIYDGFYKDRILLLDYTISPDDEKFSHELNSTVFKGINVTARI